MVPSMLTAESCADAGNQQGYSDPYLIFLRQSIFHRRPDRIECKLHWRLLSSWKAAGIQSAGNESDGDGITSTAAAAAISSKRDCWVLRRAYCHTKTKTTTAYAPALIADESHTGIQLATDNAPNRLYREERGQPDHPEQNSEPD